MMKIGVVYPQTELGGDPQAVREIGLATEALGYDHLLAYDHVVGATHDREPKLTGPYTDNDPFHDPFVMFAFLAGITERIEFVSGVIILPQRQTALVAKQTADLDLLSGERFRLGIGVGWNYVEYDALGQDFATRGARADEQIELLRRYWTEDLVTFEGRFDRVDRGNILPRPNRQIPIWIGGFAEPGYRRGGRLGDGFIFGSTEPFDAWARVKHHLKESGRPIEGFGRDLVTHTSFSVDDCVETGKKWRDAGGTHLSVSTMGMGLDRTAAHIDFITEVRHRMDAG
jgi:probable F420-dependent oxidoreductase